MGVGNFIAPIFTFDNDNDKSRKAYLAFKIAFLFTGIISMTSLTVRDLIKLQDQYNSNEPVTSVKLTDASVRGGIRLPNATLCINFEFTDSVEFDSSVNNISEIKSKHLAENLKFAQRLIHATVNINNPSLKLESFESDFSTLDDRLDNFWKNLTRTVCRTVRLQVTPVGMQMLVRPEVKGRREDEWANASLNAFDICNNDDLVGGFLTKDMNVFCIRIPLDRFRFLKRSSYTRDYTTQNFITQRIYVGLQPLFMADLYENKPRIRPASVFMYFPEKVGSYLDFQYTQESMQFGSDFWTIVKSPDDYDCGRMVTVYAEFRINAKYQRFSDKKDCVDVYDRSECTAKCMEDSYSELCKCRRKAYRHYPNINSKEYCTFRQEWECAQRYRRELSSQQYLETNKTVQCLNDCDRCVRLDFANSIRTVVSQIRLGGNFNSSDECDAIRSPWIKYELTLTSFNYPFFVDTPLITEEGYIAQIGGVFGLYLGLSGIACFTIVVQCVSWITRRWKREGENRKHADNSRLSFAQLWWTIAKLNSYDIDRNSKSYIPDTKF